MKKTDTITGTIFFILGILILISTYNFKQTLIMDNYLGASFFPRIVSVVLIFLSIVLTLSGWKNKTGEQDGPSVFTKEKLIRPFIVIGELVIYILLLNISGFCITSVLLFWSILLTSKVNKRSYYIIAPVFIGIVYAIFRYIFLVQLPVGFIGF